jgi:hypothetical protein
LLGVGSISMAGPATDLVGLPLAGDESAGSAAPAAERSGPDAGPTLLPALVAATLRQLESRLRDWL